MTPSADAGVSTAATARPRFDPPPWLPWLGGRLLAGLAVVLAISWIVFGATQALPSDPARVILGPDASEATIATLRQRLGLDQPLALQYLQWARRLLSGDLGRSLDSDVEVGPLLWARFGNSAALAALVVAIAFPLSLLAGVGLALRRDTLIDRIGVALAVLFKALPGFAVAIVLVLLFATSVLPVLPAASLIDPERPLWRQLHYLVLPALALALAVSPYLLRLVRASTIDALESEHVTAARLRGIPERRVIWRHAVPNALIPAVQGMAMTLRVLLGGVLITEVVFSYPGVGNTLNSAIGVRDIPLIQGIVLLLTVAIVAVNIAADLLTVLLTPRLRTAQTAPAPTPHPGSDAVAAP